MITLQTPLHRWLNVLHRGFGVVHAGNLLTWIERCRQWGVPSLSRVLAGAVVTERYLSHLQRLANGSPTQAAERVTLENAWPRRDDDATGS